jgi:Predicted periplasmic or secreted lipoprotein
MSGTRTRRPVDSHQAQKRLRCEHHDEEEKIMLVITEKSDRQIQQDVLRELRWDSRVADTDVGVEVDKGIVTLTGTVNSYAKRLAAREAAHRVSGVLDVAEDIQVKSPGTLERNDTEIARAVRVALTWDAFVAEEKIRSTVTDGFVTLEGEVSTLREKEDAEAAIRNLAGVQGVRNRLFVAAVKADPVKLRESIEEALERRAEREAERIRVRVEDGTVVLEGKVRTWPEKQAILGAVSHAPGVREVKDKLTVNPWD